MAMSGVREDQAAAVMAAYGPYFETIAVEKKSDGWLVIVGSGRL